METYGYLNAILQNVTLRHPQNIQPFIRHIGPDRPKAVNTIYLLTCYLLYSEMQVVALAFIEYETSS